MWNKLQITERYEPQLAPHNGDSPLFAAEGKVSSDVKKLVAVLEVMIYPLAKLGPVAIGHRLSAVFARFFNIAGKLDNVSDVLQ